MGGARDRWQDLRLAPVYVCTLIGTQLHLFPIPEDKLRDYPQ